MKDKMEIVREEIEKSKATAEGLIATVATESWIDPSYLRGKVSAYSYVLGLLDFAEGRRPLQHVGGATPSLSAPL